MKKGVIDKLCEAINAKNKRVYPETGYIYYANIAGDGRNYRTVYKIVTTGGGVTRFINGHTTRATAAALRAHLATL